MTSQLMEPSRMPAIAEQRVVLEGIRWQQYEGLLATLGDDFPNLRLSYLEGTLEIMTTSPEHEELKKMIAMLMEAYFQETRTRFHGIGSAPLSSRGAGNPVRKPPNRCRPYPLRPAPLK